MVGVLLVEDDTAIADLYAFKLRLDGFAVTIAGVDQKTAGQLVEGAHAICPYSNAIKGNVDVQIAVSVR